jgi:hypothetical protein
MSVPCSTTVAPSRRQFETLMSGANVGMTTVTGMPSSAPWYATPCRVIAGGRRDHAACARLRGQLQQRVARAALLEAAGALEIVELAIDVRAGQLDSGIDSTHGDS